MVAKYLGFRGDGLIRAVAFASTMGFLLFGYDQGVMSGIITGKTFNHDFPATKSKGADDVHTSTIQGTVTAVYELGCFAGAIFALVRGDRLGRRKMIMLGSTIMILGTIIMVTSVRGHWNLGQFIIGRVVCGVGCGSITSTIPSYQAEIAKKHNRGALVCFEASMIAIGTCIAYWIDFGLDFVPNAVAWRFPIAFQCVFAATLLIAIQFLPESPRWLLTRHREEEALEIIAFLADSTVDDPEVILLKDDMYANVKLTQSIKSSKLDIFKRDKTKNLERTLVGASSQIFQQLGGCNAVIYYAPLLYQNSLGMERTLALVLSGVTIVVYALFACIAFWLVEKVGRRPLFIIGSVGQGLSMTIVFACLIPDTKQASKGAAFGIFLYLAFFGATWLCLPWLYPAEIASMKIRTQANAVSTSCNWIFNFMVVEITPVMIASIHWGTYLFFACLNFAFIPFIYFFYPETKGRTLEELDVIFAKAHVEHTPAVKVAKNVPYMEHHEIAEAMRHYDIHDTIGGDPEKELENTEKSSSAESQTSNLAQASTNSKPEVTIRDEN
ncbi:unnamed protein product [Kuraishia capsulata CBS 1993]|uniref:Major facilitator superfamily (MFS) profile domain-containing protein n=1 Tax=Kuraishia capsulata CBS 1993 TaxID=1382522 RepID=W6MI43_9ASCO|nr:uncharacterized protein KUCA_T00001756001 [Kuraishia capsulata CBS 1993]CDK25786.1 unnamed protein product [Kuraishia capsulata CBS 1993]